MDHVKCKKCRRTLFDENQTVNLLLNAHNVPINEIHDICETVNEGYNLFLNEEHLPNWIKLRIEAGEWAKGKIYCPYCDTRLGGFDFVSGTKCSCSNNVLPCVHLVKSKVDVVKSSVNDKTTGDAKDGIETT